MLRAAVELDPAATVVPLDGRSAYDPISRGAVQAPVRSPGLAAFRRGHVHAYFHFVVVGCRGRAARDTSPPPTQVDESKPGYAILTTPVTLSRRPAPMYCDVGSERALPTRGHHEDGVRVLRDSWLVDPHTLARSPPARRRSTFRHGT